MARRDVDLVIRARDEAAKTVDTITRSLNDFFEGTKKLDQGAEKSESSLTQLGAAIAKLDKAINDASGTERLSRDLDKASSALARLESRYESTRLEAEQQGKSLSQNSALLDRYRAKLDGATKALDRQKGAVAEAQKDQRALAAAQNQAATAVERLSAKQARLPAQIAKQAASAEKAKTRFAELSDVIRGTAQPTATLQRQFEASQRSVTEKTQKLAKLQKELADVNSDLRAAGSAVTIFASQSDKAANNLSKQERALKSISQNFDNLEAQVKASGAVQTRLQSSLNKTNKSLQDQAQTIERAEASYVELATSAGRADAAIDRFAGSSLQKLSGELREQKKATLEAKREWNLATGNVKELAAQIDRAIIPNKRLNEAFDRARERARLAKTEYQLNAQALNRMGQAYQKAGRDVQSLGTASERIAAQQTRLSTELQRVADRSQRVANQTNRTDAAVRKHTGSVSRMAAAYRQFYGDSRQSLSLLQRIRGEVLSLAAAYGGLFAAIEVIRGAVNATETLAGVSSRLNVAFGGDEIQAAEELEFIRRQAERLGVTFVDLATEYSKFSVATKNTNLQGQATRDVFIGIAEAARVNRASQADLRGVFTALTQIVSKGTIQMEELKQQLGDRLPGAVQLLADSLGITTAELIKMTEQGQLSSEALIPFAEEVRNRFGPGLAEAVESTRASLARLQNAAFDALVLFSQGGFDRGFQDFVDSVTELLQSADFEQFAQRAGAAMGTFFDILSFGVENFDLLLAAGAAFIGLRLTPVVLALGATMLDMGRAVLFTASNMRGLTAATGATTTAMGGLRLAMFSLLSSTGIGLLVAAIGAGITLWATNATEATEALNTHRKIVDEVRGAYDNVGGSVDKWRESLNNLTASEAQANLRRVEQAVSNIQKEADLLARGNNSFWTNFFGYNLSARQQIFNVSKEYLDDVKTAFDRFNSGEIGGGELIELLDSVNAEFNDGSDEAIEYGEAVIRLARRLDQANISFEEARDVVTAMTGSSDEAAEAIERLGQDAFDAADGINEAAQKAEDFENAMSELRDRIPDVKRELDLLEQSNAIEGFLQKSIMAASTWGQIGEAIRTAGAAQLALSAEAARNVSGLSGASSGVSAAAAILRDVEGFISTPAWDVNAFRAGYGSDTVTLADGSVKAITQGMRISREDAERDLIRRIETEFLPTARRRAGAENFDRLSPAQQGVLTSITYNFGTLPESVAAAVRNGATDGAIAQAIRGLGARGLAGTKYEEGARRRSEQEARLFESGVGAGQAAQNVEREREEARRAREEAAEERQRQAEATQQTIADNQFELEQLDRKNAGLERQAAIEAAIRDAKQDNPDISAQELEVIKQQAAALFDKEQREKEISKQKEAHVVAEQKVQQLTQQRDALEQQRQLALEGGDTERAKELATEIGEVNIELQQAIDNAIRLWEAVGGGEADAAIAKLGQAKAEAGAFSLEGDNAYARWERVGDLFVTGLSQAFDDFAKAVAEGKSAGEAARDAFLKFASDFLLQIARMIIQQTIFNALQSTVGGTPFGNLIGVPAGHTGGLVGSARVGSGNMTKRVSPGAFANAIRYHTGGMAGFAPNEIPIIAKKGEEIITQDDPRHMLNGGGSKGAATPDRDQTIINALDGSSFLEQALNSAAGQEVLVNYLSANRETVQSILGVR